MTARTLRSLCSDTAYKFGHFVVEFATPGIGHILKGAGCEFVLFDTEHSGFSSDVVKACVRYFEAAELPAIFRVPSKSYDHLARYADMGAQGIMVPLVNDAHEAKELVSYVKYYPDGNRGVGVGLAHDNYTAGSVPEKLRRLNERNCLFVQIETAAGAENAHVPEILGWDRADNLTEAIAMARSKQGRNAEITMLHQPIIGLCNVTE